MSAQGIPTETAQPGLLGRPEAVLAIACLRRLNDSRDTVATAEILSLADCEAPEVWLQDRLGFLAAGGKSGEWRAGDRLSAHRAAGQAAHAGAAAHAARGAGAGDRTRRSAAPRAPLGAGWEGGRARLANLEALLGLAEQYEDSAAPRAVPPPSPD